MAALPHIPPPGTPGVECERKFEFHIAGVTYHGFKDLELPGVVVDYKSTSNFQWALTHEALANDEQGAIYALDTMLRTGCDEVTLKWIYLRTKGAKVAQTVTVTVDRDQVTKAMQPVHERARQILTVLNSPSITTAKQLPPDATACEEYGGCSYRALCNLSPAEQVKSIMAQDLNAFLASLGTPGAPQPNGNGAPAPQPQPQPQAQPPYSWEQRTTPAQPEAPPSMGMPMQAPLQFPQPAQPSPPPIEYRSTETLPPQVTPAQPSPQQMMTGFNPTLPQQGFPTGQPQWQEQPQPMVQPQPQPQLQPAPLMPPAQQWGPPSPQFAPPQPPPAPAKRTRRTQEEIARDEGFELFIDCIPVKGAKEQPEDGSTRLARVASQASQQLGQHFMAHQQGPAFFLHLLEQDLNAAVQIKPMAISTKSPEGAIALNTLAAKARRVTRGYSP